MRALSLWRPWPWAILYFDKRVENRSWDVKYRGEFVIHAAQTFDAEAADDIAGMVRDEPDLPLQPFSEKKADHPCGLVGVARIVDCLHYLDDDGKNPRLSKWAFGPYCAVLENVRAFKSPIPWKGQRGWFDVPDEIVREALDAK